MRKRLASTFVRLLITAFLCYGYTLHAQAPDTVKTGIYITSIHDIDFKQSEYSVNLWLWLQYKNRSFDFLQNLEIPLAKSFSKSYATVDSSDGSVHVLMKLQCVMKDSWRIENFPFDNQKLRLSFENSQYDSKALVFVPDTAGKNFDQRFTLRGWNIDSITVVAGKRIYETTFGDPSLKTPHSEYSSYKVRMSISRSAGELFWKMFMGMYIAFFIAFACFFIHLDHIDSRFGLSVGALFAVVGNKYVIESSLPDTSTFTLVDTLHGITLFCILIIVAWSVMALRLKKKDRMNVAQKRDKIMAFSLIALYAIVNVYLIYRAANP